MRITAWRMSAAFLSAQQLDELCAVGTSVRLFHHKDTYLPSGRGSLTRHMHSVDRVLHILALSVPGWVPAMSMPAAPRWCGHRLYARGAWRGGTSQRDVLRVACAPSRSGPERAWNTLLNVRGPGCAQVYTRDRLMTAPASDRTSHESASLG